LAEHGIVSEKRIGLPDEVASSKILNKNIFDEFFLIPPLFGKIDMLRPIYFCIFERNKRYYEDS
jgi:hypothetical protein